MKRHHLALLACCVLCFGCKTPAKPEEPAPKEPQAEMQKQYHDIELICGNASVKIAGTKIKKVLLSREPQTNQKLIVEIHINEDGTQLANVLIRNNSTKDLSIITPGRILLVGRMDGEIRDGIIRIASYSQSVAEEILELVTKK